MLQFLAFPDIRVTDDERRVAIYEAIGLINEQLWIGHFELWSSSGIVLYRHAAMIDGDRRRRRCRLEKAEMLIEIGDRRMRALLSGVPVRPVGRQDPQGGARRRR